MNELGEFLAIVVIGRNEGERLRDCLTSALKACPNIVYADSASTDDSISLARSMGVLVVSVDPVMPLNAARGRNAGFSAVKEHFPSCRFVQFVDGDCLLVDGWINFACEFLEMHPKVAVACGRRFEANPDASLYNRLADEEWNTPIGLTCACGGDAMMRASAFEDVGGFNPALMASEEPELAARLRHRGWEIWRLDVPMTEHDARIFTFRQWWQRTTRSGFGYAQAWESTRGLPEVVNRKLLTSALVWVVGLPLVATLLAIASRRAEVILIAPLLYVVQIFRMTFRRSDLSPHGLRTSSMLMLAKIPELLGAARVLLWAQRSAMIEYKNLGATSSRKIS